MPKRRARVAPDVQSCDHAAVDFTRLLPSPLMAIVSELVYGGDADVRSLQRWASVNRAARGSVDVAQRRTEHRNTVLACVVCVWQTASKPHIVGAVDPDDADMVLPRHSWLADKTTDNESRRLFTPSPAEGAHCAWRLAAYGVRVSRPAATVVVDFQSDDVALRRQYEDRFYRAFERLWLYVSNVTFTPCPLATERGSTFHKRLVVDNMVVRYNGERAPDDHVRDGVGFALRRVPSCNMRVDLCDHWTRGSGDDDDRDHEWYCCTLFVGRKCTRSPSTARVSLKLHAPKQAWTRDSHAPATDEIDSFWHRCASDRLFAVASVCALNAAAPSYAAYVRACEHLLCQFGGATTPRPPCIDVTLDSHT